MSSYKHDIQLMKKLGDENALAILSNSVVSLLFGFLVILLGDVIVCSFSIVSIVLF